VGPVDRDRLFAAALDLGHHVQALLLELRQPVPRTRIDRTKLLTGRARRAEPGDQTVKDRALLLANIGDDTKVRAQTNQHANRENARVQAVIDNRAVLVQRERKQLAQRARRAAPEAEDALDGIANVARVTAARLALPALPASTSLSALVLPVAVESVHSS